jgi:hypothetical protein
MVYFIVSEDASEFMTILNNTILDEIQCGNLFTKLSTFFMKFYWMIEHQQGAGRAMESLPIWRGDIYFCCNLRPNTSLNRRTVLSRNYFRCINMNMCCKNTHARSVLCNLQRCKWIESRHYPKSYAQWLVGTSFITD